MHEREYKYTMRVARRRYRVETSVAREKGFRAWARSTYNEHACYGKLAELVRRPS